MKVYFKILIGLVVVSLTYKCFLKEEVNCGLRDTIDDRHDLIKSLHNQIINLYTQIDSLCYVNNDLQNLNNHNDHPDFVKPVSSSEMISALIQVESEGNDSAYCALEDAVGCLQIRPIMVREVNRILKIKEKIIRYTLQDRWDREKSIEIFFVWKDFHHNNSNFEKIARNWNGGPRGINISATAYYWKKVKNEINS